MLIFTSTGTSNVFAEINESYKTEAVTENDFVDIISNVGDALAKPIGSFVYVIGTAIEFLLGQVSLVATGQGVMPWADAILFNAVPLLDVNFINPGEGTLVSSLSPIIRNLYFTVLSMAITFFSVAVIFMAIKLAISAISTEKAKYKQAVSKWAMGLLLLFVMHYFISFIFFVNESLVKVAARITENEIGQVDTSIKDQELKDKFNEILDNNPDIGGLSTTEVSMIRSDINNNFNLYTELTNDSSFINFTGLNKNWWDALWSSDFVNDVVRLRRLYATVHLIKNISSADALELAEVVNDTPSYPIDLKETPCMDILGPMINNLGNNVTIKYIKSEWLEDSKVSNEGNYRKLAKYVVKYSKKYGTDISGGASGAQFAPTPIGNMAEYFKGAAFEREDGKIKKTEPNFLACIMYTIFVVQSLLYFISYIKRFFFIVVLALFAPIMVVYNFVMNI